jgi:hypothetical protein
VKHNGREISYRSIEDLQKARATIQAELAGAESGARTGGSCRFSFKTSRE